MRGVHPVNLAGLDHRSDDRPSFGTGVMARDEGVLAVQGDGADGSFDGVVAGLDVAIGEEATKAVAVFWRYSRAIRPKGDLAE